MRTSASTGTTAVSHEEWERIVASHPEWTSTIDDGTWAFGDVL